MPASPIIKASLREPDYDRLCTDLGLHEKPRVVIRQGKANELRGSYQHLTNTTTLFVGIAQQDRDAMRFVAHQLDRTLIHETRHAWQFQTWGDEFMAQDALMPYEGRECEIDARKYADDNVTAYRLVNVTRKFPQSRLSRLAAAEQVAARRRA